MKRAIWIIVTIAIIGWIVSNPAGAGNSVHDWISGLVTFFHHMV